MEQFFLRVRKWRFCLLLCCVVILGLLAGSAKAAIQAAAQLRPDITIIIDGSQRTFYNAGGQEVHPILCNGTTYLPLRAIGELMGRNVDWNQDTKTVTLAGQRTTPATTGTPDSAAAVRSISAELRDDFTILIDSTVRTFTDAGGNPVYPLLYQGSTYLPIRAIGELMGKSVDWDQETKTVTLSSSLVTDADTFSGDLVTDADTFSGGTQPAAPSAGALSLEDAKAAALAHAGLTASQATFTKQELDWDDGQQIYELEFYTAAGAEYEYEISAANGTVLKSESNLGYSTPGGTVTYITQDRAQEIALGRVSGATANCITKCEWCRDDGHHCYEVELVYDCIEYEFEIDGSTGAVLSAESEVLYCNHAHHSGGRHGGGHHGRYCGYEDYPVCPYQ